jgi:hypothetical protein
MRRIGTGIPNHIYIKDDEIVNKQQLVKRKNKKREP